LGGDKKIPKSELDYYVYTGREIELTYQKRIIP
jgi:hypothetical protein